MRRPPLGATIYRRFYGYTLIVVVASIAVSVAAATAGKHRHVRSHFRRVGVGMARLVAREIAPAMGAAETIQPALDAAAGNLDARLVAFGLDRRPVGRSGEPPLPVPSGADFDLALRAGSAVGSEPRNGRPNYWTLVPVQRGDALAGFLQSTLSPRSDPPSPWPAFGSFALVLLLVAVLMVPATRSVTRPIEQLTDSARRFGAGDFAHRAPVAGDDEIAKLAAAMNDMAERLSAMLHTQRELLANVSHELRSPLTRIQVALELSRQTPDPREPLAAIEADVRELSQLIDDCLTASRLELRPESLRLSRLSVPDLLAQARHRMVAAGVPETRIALAVPPELPAATADAELCTHALENLLDNARRHTPDGTAIALGAAQEGDRLRLFVKDAGPGLPAEELPRLFEPFYRPDSSRTRAAGGGVGLGLSLVRRIAELHGGEPRVECPPGGGTTFSFTVPLAPAEGEADAPA